MKTHGEIVSAISEGVSRFEQETKMKYRFWMRRDGIACSF